MPKKIIVIDFGGQYAHLLCSVIRRFGVVVETCTPSAISASDISSEIHGIILSGGPRSVYKNSALQCDPELFSVPIPILGICYGMQLLVHHLGGKVRHSNTNQEYGPAMFSIKKSCGMFASKDLRLISKVWMSHADEVIEVPSGFIVFGSSQNSCYTAIGDPKRNYYGLQFHPEVSNTEQGKQFLLGFLNCCQMQEQDHGIIENRLQALSQQVHTEIGKRRAICLVSGGVDSTVLLGLLKHSLGDNAEQIFAFHIDTGFMREGESAWVKNELERLFEIPVHVLNRQKEFLKQLSHIYDPEKKREIIGQMFVSEQKKVIQNMDKSHDWCWVQGTIYPDTVESGEGGHTQKIKTHHNRVSEILDLQRQNKLVEPLKEFYKDEVRLIGKALHIPDQMLARYPFPGVGLAIRYLCNVKKQQSTIRKSTRQIPVVAKNIEYECDLPIFSVGVQGDNRTYRKVRALFPVAQIFHAGKLDVSTCIENAAQIINRNTNLNRAVLYCPNFSRDYYSQNSSEFTLRKIFTITRDLNDGVDILRKADFLTNELLQKTEHYAKIWQLAVISLPIGFSDTKNTQSFVIRAISSLNAMTAEAYPMPIRILKQLTDQIYQNCSADMVFYDLSHKPPATVEWE